MNNTNQNHTDNFFRQGLKSAPDFSPSEKNWQAMEALLKSKDNRRTLGWIYIPAGIAAALLVFLAFWFIPQGPASTDQKEAVDKNIPGSASSSPAPGFSPPGEILTARDSDPYRKKLNIEVQKGSRRIDANNAVINSKATARDLPFSQQALNTPLPVAFRGGLTNHPSIGSLEVHLTALNASEDKRNNAKAERLRPDQDSNERSGRLPGRWGLSMAISPDLNSVDGMDNSAFGLSLGAGVSYKLGKTISVGTGVYYSRKQYSADKTSYRVKEKPFATWTSYSSRIDADCRVIDIPVNLSFRVSNSKQHKLYATAGLSSYIMLSEKYAFKYNPSPAYPTGSREYTVRNQNEHILSVVNLGIAIEKPLNDQMSLVIQPYAKLPLTGIGQGETDLKSFGLGLRLNYSSLKKNRD